MDTETIEPKYSIIAFKEDNSDYCMNCHMASWPSAFHHEIGVSWKDAVDFLAQREFDNYKFEEREYKFKYLILRSSELVYDTIDHHGIPYDIEDERPELKHEVETLIKEAKEKAKDLIDPHWKAKEAKKKAEAEKDAKIKEMQDRRLYGELRKRFGD